MTNKLITIELINERLKASGFGEDVCNDDERLMDLVLDHHNVELTDDWERNLDYYIYTESTQDGYEVFIATYNPDKISINEDVHYYDRDLAGCLCEGIKNSNGSGKIFIGDLEEDYVIEAMHSLYGSIYDTALENITEELLNEGYNE